MVRGRSKASMMMLAWPNAHLFLFAPSLGADAYGVTFRVRRDGGWTHYRVTVCQRNRGNAHSRRRHTDRGGQRFLARPTLTILELCRWRTAPGTNQRIDMKSYLRLKASAGGRQA
jgi:hypothetical protein